MSGTEKVVKELKKRLTQLQDEVSEARVTENMAVADGLNADMEEIKTNCEEAKSKLIIEMQKLLSENPARERI